jgi:predicted NBD/HSP70 family sugar kinase
MFSLNCEGIAMKKHYYGAIELGETKAIFLVANNVDEIDDIVRIPTAAPAEILAKICDFFRSKSSVSHLGIAALGPWISTPIPSLMAA